ncbi:MAG: hypothetical protein K6G10_05840 [Butyrivibrio sp.]|nr:hypothetical protein [Butyrivibrio sp.]
MKNKKLAICIPTYERPEIIGEFLLEYMPDYLDFDLDIYVYDSGESCKTQGLVQSNEEYGIRLFYVKIPSNIHANMKVFTIFSDFGLNKEYEYVWVCSDAIQCKKKLLEEIFEVLNEGLADILILNRWTSMNRKITFYENADRVLYDCALSTTYFGGVILKTDTTLSDFSKEFYEKEFGKPFLINFSHVCFYFHLLSKKPELKCACLAVDHGDMEESALKIKNGWYDQKFEVMCTGWVDAIDSLPEIYSKKSRDKALKAFGNRVFGGDNLLCCRMENQYNRKTYLKYRDRLSRLVDYPDHVLRGMAFCPRFLLKKQIEIICSKEISKLKKLQREGADIIIYGAGKFGKMLAQFLADNKVPYTGFCVTKKENGMENVLDKPVYAVEDLKNNSRELSILLGANSDNRIEMLEALGNADLKEKVFPPYFCDCVLSLKH